MDSSEIKKANRKALPKFILIIVTGMLVGGLAGFCIAKYRLDILADNIRSAGVFFGTYIAPSLLLMTAIILPLVCILIYRGARNLLSSWDGEDERISDEIDQKLSIVIWLTSAASIVSYFLIAASYSGGFDTLEKKGAFAFLFIGIAAFMIIMIETILIQQKSVDAVKKMNPEKTASVYDLKFQKKWMDSCDEAEKIMIGRCAYKAYAAVNMVCMILGVVFAVGALAFGTGFLPSFAVCLIWIVNLSVYCKEALWYSKAGNKLF